jgi:hypothetical protein
MFLVGKWFVFWDAGIRLSIAGVRQIFQPDYTAVTIFGIAEPGADAIVRELGFANVAMGVIALVSLANSGWLVPSALIGALYYGLAGTGHLARSDRNTIEQIALISDLLIFALFAFFLTSRFV